MKLSVGTNWDEELLAFLINTPEVYEVYGCASATPVGTGRPSFLLGKTTEEEMAAQIKEIHNHGKKFSYALNGPCLNNMEYDKETHKELINHLEKLVEMGIDGFTVSIPYLLEIIKKRFPNLHAKVSLIAHVNSVQKALFFEELGADEIMLDYMINRDFQLLESIKKSVNCELGLLTNDFCLYGCPYRYYHYNICAHASQVDHPLDGFYIDYCIIRCNLDRLTKPHLMMSSRWIRPEDLHHYEDIGFDTFKISGRRMSVQWITRAVQAYATRNFDGNLADMLDTGVPGIEDDVYSAEYTTLFNGFKRLKADSFNALGNFYPVRPYIDNKALDGFIDFFKKQDCASKCAECNYCHKYADKVITFDKKIIEKQVNAYTALLEDLTSSRVFLEDNEEEIDKSTVEPSWPDSVRASFEHVIAGAPESSRLIARATVFKASNDNAANRGAMEVSEADMVNAFLLFTPEAFKSDMINSMCELGIDINKYLNVTS